MSHRRDGFALITVLWLILLLSVLVSTRLAPVLLAQRANQNRLLQVRARWAALGCLELMRARFTGGARDLSIDSTALGSVVWCEAESLAPDERVNPNVVDSVGLERVLGDRGRTAAVLDWIDADDVPRDAGAESAWYRARGRALPRNGLLQDVAELRLVRDWEGTALIDLEHVFTVRGDGRVSPNRAPAWAIASVSVLTEGHIAEVVTARERGRFAAADQLTAVTGVELSIPDFAALTTRLSFDDWRHVVRFRGRVNAGTRTIESVLVATLVEREAELRVAQLEVR